MSSEDVVMKTIPEEKDNYVLAYEDSDLVVDGKLCKQAGHCDWRVCTETREELVPILTALRAIGGINILLLTDTEAVGEAPLIAEKRLCKLLNTKQVIDNK